MKIEELAEEIADALSPRLTVDGIYHVIRWTLERDLPKLDRPPMSREEASRLASDYIARREKRHGHMGGYDQKTVREDFIAVLMKPPPKEPRYLITPSIASRESWCVTLNDPVPDVVFAGTKLEAEAVCAALNALERGHTDLP